MAQPEGQVADPVVRLEPDDLSVAAGDQVVAQLHVHNPSRVVERYSFEVLGPLSDVATVTPPELSLLPDTDGVVQVVIRPPKGPDTPAGAVPIGLRCRSGVDQFHAGVAEGTLVIGEVHDVESRLVTVAREGRWRGRFVVRVVNTGNTTTSVDLHPSEEDNVLGFALAPTRLTLERGAVERAFLTVRPTRPFLFGSPESLPFTVEVHRDGAQAGDAVATELRGTFTQRAVGPVRARGIVFVVAGLLGLGAIAAIALPRGGDEPTIATAPPTPSAIGEVQVVSHEAVRVLWDENRTANGYRVQRLVAGSAPEEGIVEEVANAPADVRAVTFEGLAPETEHCFRLVAVNEVADARPSEPVCATTPPEPAPSPSETAAPTTPDDEPSSDGSATATDEPSGSDTPTAPPDDGSTTGAGEQVARPFVVFNQFQSGDIAQQGQVQLRVQELQAAGVDAQPVFTNGLEPFEDGVWLVYESGFASAAAAVARCDELTTAGIVTRCDVIE